MERVDQANLNSALTTTGGHLRQRLKNGEFQDLGTLMEQMARRWPAQDLADSMEVFVADLEELAMQHGLHRVREAVRALRISPDQKFYPRPDEIAAEIERQRSKQAANLDVRRADEFIAQLRESKRIWERERREDACVGLDWLHAASRYLTEQFDAFGAGWPPDLAKANLDARALLSNTSNSIMETKDVAITPAEVEAARANRKRGEESR